MRIPIAEDDALSRLILEKAVRKFGHDCLVAEDGAVAWALYQREADAVDVVISDWMMPGLDGVALCRRIRAHPVATYPYVILLTALGDRAHVFAGLEAGADDYLTKPLDRDELQVRLIAAARVTALYRQLAEQKGEVDRLNRQLFAQARRDPLTGLRNRLQLEEDLAVVHAQVARDGSRYCAAMCDVDHFKQYNDHYGHPAGDQILRAVAATIAGTCRAGDTAYRYGGEEFLLLLPAQPPGAALVAVERVRRAVEALALPHEGQAPPGVVTLSAGIAPLYPGERKTIAALLEEADAALYRAKAAGRNRVVAAPAAAR